MQIPGFLWTALLALIPLLIQWLGGDYFTGQAWVPWLIVILGFIAKAIELYRLQVAPQQQQFESFTERDETNSTKVKRFLLG
jgi:uncharacterized membrane protein